MWPSTGADGLPGAVSRQWAGADADAVLITAATSSSDPVEFAGLLARDRATVVVVGDVDVAPPRSSYYHKELTIRYARSYGPGRYDARFEEDGHPYPEGYVPWTERRNLAEVLRLLATGAVDFARLKPRVFAVEDAAGAYEALKPSTAGRSVALLLRYSATAQLPSRPAPEAGSRTWTAPAAPCGSRRSAQATSPRGRSSPSWNGNPASRSRGSPADGAVRRAPGPTVGISYRGRERRHRPRLGRRGLRDGAQPS